MLHACVPSTTEEFGKVRQNGGADTEVRHDTQEVIFRLRRNYLRILDAVFRCKNNRENLTQVSGKEKPWGSRGQEGTRGDKRGRKGTMGGRGMQATLLADPLLYSDRVREINCAANGKHPGVRCHVRSRSSLAGFIKVSWHGPITFKHLLFLPFFYSLMFPFSPASPASPDATVRPWGFPRILSEFRARALQSAIQLSSDVTKRTKKKRRKTGLLLNSKTF